MKEKANLSKLYRQLEKSRNAIKIHSLIVKSIERELSKLLTTKEKRKKPIYSPLFNENSIMGITARAIKRGDVEALKQFII